MDTNEKHIADQAIRNHLYVLLMRDTAVTDPDNHILLLAPLIKARCSMDEQNVDATDIGYLIVTRLGVLNKHRYLLKTCYRRPPSLISLPRIEEKELLRTPKYPS